MSFKIKHILVIHLIVFSLKVNGQKNYDLIFDTKEYKFVSGSLVIKLDSSINNKSVVLDLFRKTDNLHSFFTELEKTDSLTVRIASIVRNNSSGTPYTFRAIIIKNNVVKSAMDILQIIGYCYITFKRKPSFTKAEEYELVFEGIEI
jgi:hypothetical protein